MWGCRSWQGKYSKFTEAIPTRAFLTPLDEDEEVEVEISKGNITHIKYRAMGELQPNGTRYPPFHCTHAACECICAEEMAGKFWKSSMTVAMLSVRQQSKYAMQVVRG